MSIRVLFLEDRAFDAEFVARQLRQEGLDAAITRVETEEAFREALTREAPDIILADYHLPTFDGLAALAIARELAPQIPFIFVSGGIGEMRAVEALRNGATDYVLKDRIFRLPSAVMRALEERKERERRREAEATLRKVNERFRFAMIATHDLIWEWEVATNRVWTNRFREQDALIPDAVETLEDLLALMHPDDAVQVGRSVRETLASTATTATVEYRMAAPGGGWRWMLDRHVVLRDDDGEAVRIMGAAMDVTEQRRAEDERNRLARRNELLLNAVQEGICGLDPEGRILYANAAAARILRCTTEDILRKNIHDVAHHSQPDGTPLPLSECPVLAIALRGEVRAYETVLWRTDGTSFPAEIDCARVFEDDRLTGLVMSFSDLTERRQLERQLEQSRRISDLGRLAATMAHEFNNVLMGMQPFVEILERRSSDPAVQQIARQLGRSTQRGKAVTQEILRFATDSPVELAPFEITSWLESLTGELSALLGTISLVIDAPPRPLQVLGDATALHQVITNLAINARDAMPGGGTVTLRARAYDGTEDLPFVPVLAAGEALHLTVSDTGKGIAPNVLERIFEPLFTTKKNGNGLGLPFAHRTIARHGGQLFAESVVGRGTTFHILIPLAPEGTAATAAPAIEGREAQRRILVVDDDPEVAGATAAALDFSGFVVEMVATGAAVEPAIERFVPHAVVLDIGLPDESGLSVYARVAARWPELPVVFASGHIVDHHLVRDLGANTASLTKPYRLSELIAILGRLMKG